MTRYALTHIARFLGDQTIDAPQEIEILLTDSRSLTFPEVTLFIPLVTDRGNGHRYIKELYKKGVRAFLCSEGSYSAEEYTGATFLYVEDTYQALCRIAKCHRMELNDTTIVGITGSNGKTTVKELAYQLTGSYLNVGRSPKSYNSSIGVPLSLWSLEPGQEIALIEAGISKPSEMMILEEMIKPEIGILTNIGEAHQENFSSLQEKLREKLRLFNEARLIIYPADDPLIRAEVTPLLEQKRGLAWSRTNRQVPLYIQKEIFKPDTTSISARLLNKELSLQLPL